jgi:hypothetical protein
MLAVPSMLCCSSLAALFANRRLASKRVGLRHNRMTIARKLHSSWLRHALRRYRPEQHYMRGGRTKGAKSAAFGWS